MNKAKRFFILFGLLAASCMFSGCSGVNYTHGVSPATFLLPGLVNTEEPNVDTPSVREDTTALVLATQNL